MTRPGRGKVPAGSQGLRLRTALILDDERERRTHMREGLLDHGVKCHEAATLSEAIGRLASSRYDLVVCDMVLCDPPGAANPAFRGYLAVCYALAQRPPGVVVQASSLRRWAHPGSVLANGSVAEVVDLVYGWPGVRAHSESDGGCPWLGLELAAAAAPERRAEAVSSLLRQPVVRELEDTAGLAPVLDVLNDAANGLGEWDQALCHARRTLFPGGCHGR